MNIEQIKVYRINDKIVWTDSQPIEELKKLIDRDTTMIPSSIAPIPTLQVKQETEEVKVQQPNIVSHQSGTKLERAHAIYKANADKSRKEIIQLFVTELNMTPAGASTYHAQCKKR
jgi:hypothetical protein